MDNQEIKPQEAKPQEAKPQETKAPEPKAPEPKPQAEKQTNCLGCGKPLVKLKIYYRDGKFYCSKKCWRKLIKSKKEQEQK